MLKRNEQIDTIENHHSKRSHCIHFNKLYRIFFFVCLLNNSLFLCVRIGICMYVCVIMRLCPFHGNFFGMIYLKPNNNNPIWIKKKDDSQMWVWLSEYTCRCTFIISSSSSPLSYRLNILQIRNFIGRRTNHRKRFVWQPHTHTHTHTLQCDLFILFVTLL